MKQLFVIAGLYDGILGAAFLLGAGPIFDLLGVTRPNHLGYVHFPALLLIVFGAMFFEIARDPQGRKNLIPYGIALKASYVGTVAYHMLLGGIPAMWVPWAVFDVYFLVAFFYAYRTLSEPATR